MEKKSEWRIFKDSCLSCELVGCDNKRCILKDLDFLCSKKETYLRDRNLSQTKLIENKLKFENIMGV